MVVNYSLVIVAFVNRNHAQGVTIMKALHDAGVARFRPLILTSLTTFAGLTPLLTVEQMLEAGR